MSSNIPTIPNAKGIDLAFNEIQEIMNGISWIENSYSRAKVLQEIRDDAPYTIAKVYDNKREWIPIEPDDRVRAFSFNYINSARGFESYNPRVYTYTATQDASLIVFANLEEIDNTMDYQFNENLIEDVLFNLNQNSKYINSITSVSEGINLAWSDFSYSSFNVKFYKENFSTFRVDYQISYKPECYEETIYNKINC